MIFAALGKVVAFAVGLVVGFLVRHAFTFDQIKNLFK